MIKVGTMMSDHYKCQNHVWSFVFSSELLPLPIIGMSANTDKDSKAAAQAAGMNTFIAKVGPNSTILLKES